MAGALFSNVEGPRHLFFLGIAVLTAVAGGLAIAVASPTLLLIGFIGILAIAVIAFVDTSSLLIVATILTTAISVSFWLDHRVVLGGVPVSVPDVTLLVYGLYGIFHWVRCGKHGSTGWLGTLVLIWVAYSSLVGITVGIQNGNPLYAILQEYRLVLYATVAFFATAAFFKPERHLMTVMLGVIAAGALVSIWQLAISFSGAGFRSEELVYIYADGVRRDLRDIGLPLYFAGTALIMLVLAHIEGRSALGKLRHFSWLLIPMFVLSMAISMTRTVWVCLILSIVALLGCTFVSDVRNKRLFRPLVVSLGVGLAIGISYLVLFAFLPSVRDALESSWNYTLTERDNTAYGRLETARELVGYFADNAQHLILGLGFGNMWSGATRSGPFTDIHNAYLGYVVIGGLPGLLMFLGVWLSPVLVYVRMLRQRLPPAMRVYMTASCLNSLVFSVVLLSIPPHWSESAWLGMSLGIAAVISREKIGDHVLRQHVTAFTSQHGLSRSTSGMGQGGGRALSRPREL